MTPPDHPSTTLIAATELQALIASGQPLMVFDCSFDLTSPSAGAQQFAQAHIPGAVYADLDKNLSAKHGAPGAHGTLVAQEARPARIRRPPPFASRERFAMWLSSVGFSNDMQAVVYDRQGANYCGRLWWMLKWAGHDAVAVLDGGLQAWQAAGGAVASGDEPAHFQSHFTLHAAAPLGHSQRSATKFAAAHADGGGCAGPHATGARQSRWTRGRSSFRRAEPALGPNLGSDGRFKTRSTLRAEFDELWQAATRPPWCTNAAAGQRHPQSAGHGSRPGFGKTSLLRAAGANGAATRRVRSSGLSSPEVQPKQRFTRALQAKAFGACKGKFLQAPTQNQTLGTVKTDLIF